MALTKVKSDMVVHTASGIGAVERKLKEKMGEIVSVKDFGAVGDGATNDTNAFALAFAASKNVYAPPGTYRVNLVIGNNNRLLGSGRGSTIFKAANPGLPILNFNEKNSSLYYFIGGGDFTVDGEDTAIIGVKIGTDASDSVNGGTVTYGSLERVYVRRCVDNIYVSDTVGFELNHIYSEAATNRCLRIDTNDITTVLSVNCSAFRLGKTGLDLRGGALIKFKLSIIEANRDVGLFYFRGADSGARQVEFDTCWFEGNGFAPVNSYAGSMYIDLDANLNGEYALGLRFTNSTLASAPGAFTVYLNRGDEVTFDRCLFDGLTSTKLHYESGPAAAYATLRQCGTINNRASPAVYASFPALNSNGARLQGFKYEYWYQGYKYTNAFKHSFYWQVVGGVADVTNVSGNGNEYTTQSLAATSSSSLLYDHGANFNKTTGIFTAPFSGDFEFNVVWPITNFTAAMTHSFVTFIVNPAGSAQRYTTKIRALKSLGTTDIETFEGRIRLSLNAGDQVIAAIRVEGGTGSTASIYRGSSVFAFTGAAV